MRREFFRETYDNPIVAAVMDKEKIQDALNSPCKVVFLLDTDLLTLEETVKKFHDKEKLVYLHIDLVAGLSRDTIALEYVLKHIKPDGIISTKSSTIKAAKEMNIFTIQRLFLLDSMALETGIRSIRTIRPDAVEILPGVIPKIIKEIVEETNIPIIAGGLIRDKEDVINGLNAGAIAISTSREEVWYM